MLVVALRTTARQWPWWVVFAAAVLFGILIQAGSPSGPGADVTPANLLRGIWLGLAGAWLVAGLDGSAVFLWYKLRAEPSEPERPRREHADALGQSEDSPEAKQQRLLAKRRAKRLPRYRR